MNRKKAINELTRVLLTGLAAVIFVCGRPALAEKKGKKQARRPRSPTDLEWLRKECGDGALAYEAQKEGRIYLVELSTGKIELVGNGNQPEFSPDSSKLAWIDGEAAKGRMRKGDTTVHLIANGVSMAGGVHWIAKDEVVVLKDDKWFRVKLSGESREVPELTKLGQGGHECDVKLGKGGVWSYVAGTTWKTSDGKEGKIDGDCSPSLSPDGKSVTGLEHYHQTCNLTRMRLGGVKGKLKWVYDFYGTKGFDNQRWSSNDGRFIVCQDEKYNYVVVMKVGSTYCTRMGKPVRKQEMYGDFTVGDGRGDPWPRQSSTVSSARGWPSERGGLMFLWENGKASNTVPAGQDDVERNCRLTSKGMARLGRFHDLLPAGGIFVADDVAGGELARACRRSNELTIEAVITPGNTKERGRAKIIAFASGKESYFVLCQNGNSLVLSVNDSPDIKLANLTATRARHVIVVCAPGRKMGRVVAYVEGRPTAQSSRVVKGFGQWKAGRLMFGGRSNGNEWRGRLEGIALYCRALRRKEATANYNAIKERLRNRRPLSRLILQAKLIKTAPIPDASNYPQALVVYRYEVEKVIYGGYQHKALFVAHWGVINGRIQESIRGRQIGSSSRLVLERFAEHPELKTLQIAEIVDNEALDLPRYFDASVVSQ